MKVLMIFVEPNNVGPDKPVAYTQTFGAHTTDSQQLGKSQC